MNRSDGGMGDLCERSEMEALMRGNLRGYRSEIEMEALMFEENKNKMEDECLNNNVVIWRERGRGRRKEYVQAIHACMEAMICGVVDGGGLIDGWNMCCENYDEEMMVLIKGGKWNMVAMVSDMMLKEWKAQ